MAIQPSINVELIVPQIQQVVRTLQEDLTNVRNAADEKDTHIRIDRKTISTLINTLYSVDTALRSQSTEIRHLARLINIMNDQ